jgi:hypothetical protein
MAIIFLGLSECPLCGEVLKTGQSLVETSAFIENPSHRLWKYSDAAMHYECFQSWPLREEFVATFNKAHNSIIWGNGKTHRMNPDGTIDTIEVCVK